jgi:hypothetical protein
MKTHLQAAKRLLMFPLPLAGRLRERVGVRETRGDPSSLPLRLNRSDDGLPSLQWAEYLRK